MTSSATTVGPENSWRLVYDSEKNVISYFESDGYTTSKYTIFESATEHGCIAEASRLGLELPLIEIAPAAKNRGGDILDVEAN